MKKVVIILLILSGILFANEGTTKILFQQGNDFYQKGEFQSAIQSYEQALEQGYESAELYYNLGNAYYRTGVIGKTILNYERAKRLAPKDADIQFNMELAQLLVVDKIVTPQPYLLLKIWRAVKYAFSTVQLSFFVLVFVWLLVVVISIYLLTVKSSLQHIGKSFILTVSVLLGIITFIFGIRVSEDFRLKEAVILSQKVSVVSSPAVDATEVFDLHEGVKVNVVAQSGEFVRISLADGKIGWVKAKVLEII